MALNVNVNVQWWSGDKLHKAFLGNEAVPRAAGFPSPGDEASKAAALKSRANRDAGELPKYAIYENLDGGDGRGDAGLEVRPNDGPGRRTRRRNDRVAESAMPDNDDARTAANPRSAAAAAAKTPIPQTNPLNWRSGPQPLAAAIDSDDEDLFGLISIKRARVEGSSRTANP